VPYRTGGVRHQVSARLVGAALATLLFVVLPGAMVLGVPG